MVGALQRTAQDVGQAYQAADLLLGLYARRAALIESACGSKLLTGESYVLVAGRTIRRPRKHLLQVSMIGPQKNRKPRRVLGLNRNKLNVWRGIPYNVQRHCSFGK
jgi:hypothetical protein